MGMSLTNTGNDDGRCNSMRFYLSGNWEKGRSRRQWLCESGRRRLAGREIRQRWALIVPDRLAYRRDIRDFFQIRSGLLGRWKGRPERARQVSSRTGNFKQEVGNFPVMERYRALGASKRSNSFVTIRNQNSAGDFGRSVNSQVADNAGPTSPRTSTLVRTRTLT